MAALQLDPWRQTGDPEADGIAKAVHEGGSEFGGKGFAAVAALVGKWNPGQPMDTRMPPEMAEFLLRPYQLPAWADLAAVQRAQAFYACNDAAGQVVLATCSLPVLYIYPEVCTALVSTGRLLRFVRPRLEETLVFVEQAMRPGSLNGPGEGWQWMRKVRLLHAIIRITCAMPAHSFMPDNAIACLAAQMSTEMLHPMALWKEATADKPDHVPLNQVELAFVLQTFSWLMVASFDKLGIDMSASEHVDFISAWSLVGHMIGIVDDLLPGSLALPDTGAAEQIYEGILGGLLAVDDPLLPERPKDPLNQKPALLEDGRILMGALLVVLVDILRNQVPAPFRAFVARWHWLDDAVQSLPRMIVRRMLGLPTAQLLRLGRLPLLHWIVGTLALKLIDLRKWNDA